MAHSSKPRLGKEFIRSCTNILPFVRVVKLNLECATVISFPSGERDTAMQRWQPALCAEIALKRWSWTGSTRVAPPVRRYYQRKLSLLLPAKSVKSDSYCWYYQQRCSLKHKLSTVLNHKLTASGTLVPMAIAELRTFSNLSQTLLNRCIQPVTKSPGINVWKFLMGIGKKLVHCVMKWCDGLF